MRNRVAVEVKDENGEAFEISAVRMTLQSGRWEEEATREKGEKKVRDLSTVLFFFPTTGNDTYLIASSFFLTLLEHFMAIFLHFQNPIAN